MTFDTIVAIFVKSMNMYLDLYHTRDQIELTLARIYSRYMATISDGNISVWVSRSHLNMGKSKFIDITRVTFSGEVGIECPK